MWTLVDNSHFVLRFNIFTYSYHSTFWQNFNLIILLVVMMSSLWAVYLSRFLDLRISKYCFCSLQGNTQKYLFFTWLTFFRDSKDDLKTLPALLSEALVNNPKLEKISLFFRKYKNSSQRIYHSLVFDILERKGFKNWLRLYQNYPIFANSLLNFLIGISLFLTNILTILASQ